MPEPIETLIYQFKVVLRRVSPMIWRRLLVRSDETTKFRGATPPVSALLGLRVTFRLQLVTIADSGQEQVREVARFQRAGVELETLGLSLAEGKLILKNIQENVVQEQIEKSLARQRCCPECGKFRTSKGHHDVTVNQVVSKRMVKKQQMAWTERGALCRTSGDK